MPDREVVLYGGYADGMSTEVSYCDVHQQWPELYVEIEEAPIVEHLVMYGGLLGAVARIPVRVVVYRFNPETDRYEFNREEVHG